MERTIRVAVLLYALWLCPSQQCLGQGVDSLLKEYARFSKKGGDLQSSAAVVEPTLARTTPAAADSLKHVAGPTPPAPFTPPGLDTPAAAATKPVDSRPILECLVPSGDWCIYCNWWKQRGDSGLPFRLEFVVTDTQPAFGWPTFRVPHAPDGREWFIGNSESSEAGARQVVSKWRKITGNTADAPAPPLDSAAVTDGAQAPTPIEEVRRILEILKPRPDETFVDYGCGDGRWLIEASKVYGCRAVGVELDPIQAVRARLNVAIAGLMDRVTIIEGDAMQVDVDADVGVCYLYPDVLKQLQPKLAKLDRFASYMHRVDGLAMRQDGDAWIWRKPEPMPQVATRPRGAVWGGRVYSGPVCNSPGCRMCQSIRNQLGYR